MLPVKHETRQAAFRPESVGNGRLSPRARIHRLAQRWLLALLAAGALLAPARLSAATAIGQPLADAALTSADGQATPVGELCGERATVLAFLGTECPLARQYALRLEELAKEYTARGVRLVGVMANVQDTPSEIASFAGEFHLTFPLYRDAEQKLLALTGVERTPEVVLLDAEHKVRYRGRVDDQYGIGVQRPAPTRRDLVLALDEVLAGKPVSHPEQPAVGCLIGRLRPVDASAPVTYSNQVARIFERRCVECHRPGEIGPFSLTSYQEVLGWGDMICEVVQQRRMPPWFASDAHGEWLNDPRLTEEEIATLRQWVDAGCPEGNPQDLPPPRQFVGGWNIPQPDLVVSMSDKPFQVPAEGVLPYENYIVDLGLTEDKWVAGCEARPSNRSVVHHILVYLIDPGERLPTDLFKGSLIAAYAPGAPPKMMEPGVARRVKAGSKVMFQMHYTTNGRAQEDLSSLGLVFCDPATVRQEFESGWAVNFLFAIPPGDPNYKVMSYHKFREDRLLIQLTPHMHMRGKSFRYEAVYPDKTVEVLLDVPRYDFNWQIDYFLKKPKLMPKGTQLRCTAHFDNSPGNTSNPDPTRRVTFGEQTWDEMMIGFFGTISLPRDSADDSVARGPAAR